MKIVVADDHPLVVEGVKTVLAKLDPESQAVAAKDYPELLEVIGDGLDIALIIMDLNMPGMNGFDGFFAVQEKAPAVPVVILSASEDRAVIRKVLECGAAGYIFKSSGGDTMLEALSLVLEGETYLPPQLDDVASNIVGGAAFGDGNRGLGIGAAALNRLPVGVVVVDKNSRVIFMNRKAAAIVAQADGLEVDRSGVCRASESSETNMLHKTIAAAAGDGTQTLEDGALALSRPSMARSLSVTVSPMQPDEQVNNMAGPLAMLFVSDPEQEPELSSSVLARLYDLTDAESRIVQGLVQGKRLEDIAEGYGVSMNTVRSHLKQVFRKTGTNRQPDLVKMVLTGSAVLVGRAEN